MSRNVISGITTSTARTVLLSGSYNAKVREVTASMCSAIERAVDAARPELDQVLAIKKNFWQKAQSYWCELEKNLLLNWLADSWGKSFLQVLIAEV